MTQHKPKLSFWQIWNMSFGFLGIQFGFELQNSNVSRIFETLGANKDDIPILWIAAPLTGLLVQPIIGYLSDRTWHPYWGRRRPYFFIGAILATIALLIMPNSPSLWVAGGMLWIMDASINISMEPFRAFVGDKLNPGQRTAGFAMQSFFIGTGSVVAALLPWIFTNWFDLSNDSTSGIPEAVKWSFYAGAFAFFTAVMYTVFTTKEFPPESIEKLREENKRMSFLSGLRESYEGILHMPKTMKQLAWVQFFTWFALFSMWIYSTNAVTSNIYDMKIPRDLYTKLVDDFHANRASTLTPKELGGITQDMNEIEKFQADALNVTLTVNLANEFLKSRNLVTADKNTLIRVQAEYNTGANWLGVCSSIRNGVAAVFAFIIPLIAIRLGRKRTHMISLVIGGLGLASLNFVSNPNSIAFSMALVGIAWASILSMPYAMLAGSLPPNKMGYFMGVFNFFIVIPQILAATILGFLTMNLFEGNTMLTITLGGLMMIVAGLLCLRVDDK